MSIAPISNGESGLSVRTKLNQALALLSDAPSTVGQLDQYYAGLVAQINALLVELSALVSGETALGGSLYRDALLEMQAIRDYVTELDYSKFTDVAELRTTLSAAVEGYAANFEERITAAASETAALSERVTQLSATADGILASVQEIQTARIEDNESFAQSLTALSAEVGEVSAGGQLRMTVEATPEGALSRIGMKALATTGEIDSERSAAMYLEAIAGGASRVVFNANKVVFDGKQPFIFDGVTGTLYLGGDVRVGGDLIVNDAISRLSFAEMISGTVNVDSTYTASSPRNATLAAEITPVDYGSSARNRLKFTVSGILRPSSSGASEVTFGIYASTDGATWTQLAGAEMRREFGWPSSSNNRDVPFCWELDDRLGDGADYTQFKVGVYGLTSGQSCAISKCKMTVQQLNK